MKTTIHGKMLQFRRCFSKCYALLASQRKIAGCLVCSIRLHNVSRAAVAHVNVAKIPEPESVAQKVSFLSITSTAYIHGGDHDDDDAVHNRCFVSFLRCSLLVTSIDDATDCFALAPTSLKNKLKFQDRSMESRIRSNCYSFSYSVPHYSARLCQKVRQIPRKY